MTDLDALADRLDLGDFMLTDLLSEWGAYVPAHFKEKHGFDADMEELRRVDEACRTAARILRAVAAAPGPLRPPPGLYEPDAWDHWADALADAVGEPD